MQFRLVTCMLSLFTSVISLGCEPIPTRKDGCEAHCTKNKCPDGTEACAACMNGCSIIWPDTEMDELDIAHTDHDFQAPISLDVLASSFESYGATWQDYCQKDHCLQGDAVCVNTCLNEQEAIFGRNTNRAKTCIQNRRSE